MIEQAGTREHGHVHRDITLNTVKRSWFDRRLLGVWLALRLLTSLWVALLSPLRPMTAAERSIAVWPPSTPLGAWLGRVLLAPWHRWDVKYYMWIVERGYRIDDGTAQFHPLLAWLATPIAAITGNALLALLLVSSLASIALILAFERLARLDLQPAMARTATLLLLCSPIAFVFFAPYTEGLFLLWGVLCLYWARQGAWWRAGLAGALATLTRQQGVLLALPLAWELWEAAGRRQRGALTMWRSWLSLLLIPAGLLLWLVYRAVALGDLSANFSNPHALIYSLLVSPSASKVVPVQALLPPWQVLTLAIKTFITKPTLDVGVDLALGIWFLAMLAVAWHSMRASYRIYAVAVALLSFSYYTGPFFPYMGLPRHLLLAFPVFIGLAPTFRRSPTRSLLLTLSVVCLLGLLLLYEFEAWVT